MKYNVLWLLGLALFSNYFVSFSQGTEEKFIYKVGSHAPEFVLKEMINYPKKTAKLSDFKGKWLILDFWTVGCSVCVASFPKVDALQKTLGDKASIIVVGKTDRLIRPLFEKFQKHYSLDFIAAFDTVMFSQFKIETVPHIVWIDKKGIIRQITTSPELTLANVEAVMRGDNIVIPQKDAIAFSHFTDNPLYDMEKPILFNDNFGSDSDFLYRSVLINWKPGMPYNTADFGKELHWSGKMSKGYQMFAVTMSVLYKIAYAGNWFCTPWDTNCYGKFYPWPVVEIQDSAGFAEYSQMKTKSFCYSLIVPKDKMSDDHMMLMMQHDLSNYFGWNVQLETRMMPYWKIVLKDSAHKLLTRGGEPYAPADIGAAGFKLVNLPTTSLVSMIYNFHEGGAQIVDETGITGNIDIDFNAVMTDLADIKRELERHGMDLLEAQKLMKVIVIRDKLVRNK